MVLVQFGVFWTTGQICSATSRVLVHTSLMSAFKARLKQRSEAICIADPQTPESRMGPIVNQAQHDKVMAAIQVCMAQHLSLQRFGMRFGSTLGVLSNLMLCQAPCTMRVL